MSSTARGFTFIEVMMTLAIVALMASVAAPVMQLTIKRSKEQELTRALNQLRDAIDGYKQAVDDGLIARAANESGYPKNLQVLIDGVENQQDPKRGKLRFLRHLPRDPFAVDPQAATAWGLRAYASSAEAPEPGEDIYDVYSQSTGVGLNGVPYSQW